MRTAIVIAVAVGFLTFSAAVFPQTQDTKIRVSVSQSGEDSVGQQFAYAVREAVRASNEFRLVSEDESGMQVVIVTIDPERSSSSGNYWTAASVTYTMTNFLPIAKGNPQTWYPIYLTSQVMTIGSKRVDEQARSVMAALDQALDRYKRDAKK